MCAGGRVCLCACVRTRACVCVCMHAGVCVCVCVCERERESGRRGCAGHTRFLASGVLYFPECSDSKINLDILLTELGSQAISGP